MTIQKTLALVLHRRPWREFHQVLWLLTESHGLLPIIGYGIGHFGSKRSSHLDIGNLCDIELEKRHGHWSIRYAHARQTHKSIKSDLLRLGILFGTLNILAKALPVELAQPKIFLFVTRLLETLEENRSPFSKEKARKIYKTTERKMLELLGYGRETNSSEEKPSSFLGTGHLDLEHIRDHLKRGEETLEFIIGGNTE